jgi:hypothetical protein
MANDPNREKYLTKDNKFKTGNPGKPKGIKHKNANLKVDFLNVWREGGIERLREIAYKNDKNFMWFTQIISKMLPSNLTFGEEESSEIKLSIKKIVENMADDK